MPKITRTGSIPAVASPVAGGPSLDEVALGTSLLRRGTSGDGVRALQQLLRDRGQIIATDGRFGPLTEAAVRAFQTKCGIAADGVVGKVTLAHLRGDVPAPGPDGMDPPLAPSTPSTPVTGLPDRPADAETGSAFMARTSALSRPQREQAILAELSKGNVPDFERAFKDVTVSMVGPDGARHEGVVHVLPDYLAIGSNDDFVRIPMSPLTAQRIADQYGCLLPTTKIVDATWQQAEVKLVPSPMRAGAQMMSNDYFLRHQQTIERQRAGQPLGALVAGDKKDVVLSNALYAHPGRVAIYGWQQPSGHNIQPLSTVHESTYADYSHGVRLVSGTMTVDGVERPVAEVLADPVLCKLVSDEGVVKNPRVPS
jgi:peptidoglycan hydrolase-like protein with peptidoglycan-binding domain